ncbi:putative chitinase [Trachipleistophora hominis]|uniref:Putative chitinase n=1 Tax=Trachipleistophora hominis TaxID=72359 RepID=L7JYN2_TRAHO|nr:putative chitinase [Trachipleistophora hominis]
MLILQLINQIRSLCLPGSSECEGDTMKMCDLNGEWVVIDCPANSQCILDNNKITCSPAKENESLLPEPLASNKNSGQQESGTDKKEDKEKEIQNSTESKPSDQKKTENQSNIPNSNSSTAENKSEQPEGTQMPAEKQSQPDESKNTENKAEPDKKDEPKPQEQPKPSEPPKESVKPLEDKQERTITVYKTVTEKIMIETQDTAPTMQEIVKTVKRPDLPCCDEDLQESCRICRDTKPIRAIVIDRESLLGAASEKQQGPSAGTGSGQPTTGGSDTSGESSPPTTQGENTAQPGGGSGASQPAQGGASEGGGAQQSSGPPKSPPGHGKAPLPASNLTSANKNSKTPAPSGQTKKLPVENLNKDNKKSTLKGKEDQKLADATAGSQSSSSSGGGNAKITESQIKQVTSELGYKPPDANVKAVADQIGKFKTTNEAAMFLAQIIHESGGLVQLIEKGCEQDQAKCGKNYDDGQGKPGKYYFGRGFIQLSWAANYKAASEGIGMGTKLLDNPDQVGKDPKIAMQTSVWYWQTKVANAPGVKENKFGATTKAINGALECKGQNVDKSKKRYDIYKKVVKVLNIKNPASESGCYN